MKECRTKVWAAGDRSADMSTRTVGFKIDRRIRQQPKIGKKVRISSRSSEAADGRAKNSARQQCGFVAGVCAPVLSRLAGVALPRIGTNRTLQFGHISRRLVHKRVAAQNRRGQTKIAAILWARRVSRPTVACHGLAGEARSNG
jgi:hypothetical protein